MIPRTRRISNTSSLEMSSRTNVWGLFSVKTLPWEFPGDIVRQAIKFIKGRLCFVNTSTYLFHQQNYEDTQVLRLNGGSHSFLVTSAGIPKRANASRSARSRLDTDMIRIEKPNIQGAEHAGSVNRRECVELGIWTMSRTSGATVSPLARAMTLPLRCCPPVGDVRTSSGPPG